MDNLTYGNPVAHRVRVHFVSTSTVIYEGMPVCYNFDTTTNWAGGSVSDGAVTASTTLTAGSPATAQAKYIEVETPAADNIQWFAGVVAKGGWVGKTTSSTSGVGQLLDIYVPNGAIVPVRAGVACTVGRTILSVISAIQYLGHALDATQARPVAITEETVDRSTAGLILAKLDPNQFIYQDNTGDALYMGAGDTAAAADQVLNRINVSSAQTAGVGRLLQMQLTLTGTGAGGGDCIRAFTWAEGTAIAANVFGIWGQVVLGADSVLGAGYTSAGGLFKTHVLSTSGDPAGYVTSAYFCLGLDRAITGKTAQFMFEHTTIAGVTPDYLFVTHVNSGGTESIGYGNNTTHTNASTSKLGAIKIHQGWHDRDAYIYVYSDAGA